MAKTRKTDRKTCRIADSSISLSPTAPRKSNTIVDTLRRARLLCDVHSTAGKLPRKKLFEAHNIPPTTGYRILQSNLLRRGQGVYNRGRKPILAPHERDAIETVKNASFCFGTATHYANASAIGLANGSERTIQRNMAEYGVETYLAQQKKYIYSVTVKKRGIWGFERRYWCEDEFKRYRYSNECHFACGLQRQACIHRRWGRKA
jgi:hypothetical protein